MPDKMRISRIASILVHPIFLILLIWLVAVSSRFIKNGEVYGLNYLLFQPDGALYQAFTVKLQGGTWSESAAKVNEFYESKVGIGYLGSSIDPVVQKVIFGRPLLSILSVPFVAILGQYGMLAIPVLSYLVLGLVIYAIGRSFKAEYYAVVIFLMLSLSTSVNRWMVSNLTDGLLVGLLSVICLLLVRNNLRLYLIPLVILALLTRPSGPVIFAFLLPFIFASKYQFKKVWIAISLVLSISGTLGLALFSPESAGTQTSGEYTVFDRISDFFVHALKVVVVEAGQLIVMDRVLFIFLLITLLVAIRTWKSPWSQSFFLVFLITLAMGSWNGALGVNFRYQLPVIVPASVVLLSNLDLLQRGWRKLTQTQGQS